MQPSHSHVTDSQTDGQTDGKRKNADKGDVGPDRKLTWEANCILTCTLHTAHVFTHRRIYKDNRDNKEETWDKRDI